RKKKKRGKRKHPATTTCEEKKKRGRPRQVPTTTSKTFRLPTDLVERLETAADLRGKGVTDVVRELLEAQNESYIPESLRWWEGTLIRIIAAAWRHPALAVPFARQKDKEDVVVPGELAADKRLRDMLLEAFVAYKELQKIQPDPIPVEVLESLTEKVRAW